MPFKIIFFIAFMCSQALLGQSVDTLEANQRWNTGRELYRQQKYDSAQFYFRTARELFIEAQFPVREGECLLWEGNCQLRKRNLHEALDFYEQCFIKLSEVFPEDHIMLATPINNLGRVYHELGELFTSREYIEKAAAIRIAHYGEDHIASATSYYNLGLKNMDFGDYRQAMEYYLKALPIYLKHYGNYHRSISNLYVNMGILYDKMGDVSHAIEYYQKANEIDIKTHGESYWLLAYNYINLGISYYNMEADSLAQLYFEKSIVIGEANQLHELYATSYYELGNLKARKQDHEQALQYYQQAVNIVTDHLGDNHPRLHHFFAAISAVKKVQGNYPEAEAYQEAAITNVIADYGEIHPFLGRNYQKLAALYRAQGKFAQAHESIERGISAITPEQIQLEVDHYSFDNLLDLTVFLDLLREKAAILEAEHMASTGDERAQFLRAALDYYQLSNALIDHMRRGYMAEASKVLLQKEAVEVYENAIHLCKELYGITDSVHYLATAFQFSEKNKATILAETLQAADLTQLQGIPQEILEEEKTLKQKIAFAEQKLIDHPTDTVIAQEVFYFKWQYDSLAKTIANQYPQYYDLKYNLEVVSVDELQKFLTDKAALLSYFEGDSVWYVFCITRNTLALNTVSKKIISQDNLKGFHDAISNDQSDYTAFSHLSYSLYEQLIHKPIGEKALQHLIIIPDGILGHIPFDALVTLPFEETASRPHYLIEDYTLSYANSVTLLLQSAHRSSHPQISYAGFAPEYPENLVASSKELVSYRDVLSQLSGTQEEVSAAGAIFSGITFLNKQATEFNFKNLGASPAILHLAMHALVDDQDPMRSRLLFTDVSDSVEDGSLHAYEIYNLRLGSSLAVLSACNTGYGRVHKGEGVMSLSRAFMYAGCPSIVMSLWRAKDQPTTQIIRSFFENLKKGMPKDEALQQAKLAYLQQADPLKAHPSNWATFVLLGNSDPVVMVSGNRHEWVWVILLVLIIAALSFFFIRKKKTTVVSS